MLLMHAYENGSVLDEEQLVFLAGEQVTNFDNDVDDLALNVDHVFEADQCDAFDSDVDEGHLMTRIFHLSNIIPYDQYVEDNEEHVVQSNVSSVRNDALMSILDEMHEQGVQSMSVNKQDKVVNDSVTSELARYKELVGVYEQRAKFELTDRERKIDEQMRIIISDRNRKETSLKSELHSAQLQLRSTLNHHKTLREEAIILKKDFKQKEDKFLEEFLDIKRLKEKVEDRLYKQDQSVQTVHMLCKPKSFYDEKKKVAIGYKNPLCLTRAKQVQSALYNGNEIVRTNHAPAVVHDSEDTLKIAEITRKRMLEKVKSPLCVENKIKIAPPDYSKENLLATFAPQRDLTPEQIFWSKYVNEIKRAETLVPKPLSALTVYPPNTPVKLVPRVLPIKSVTEGERGFEQTKRCYLTEVIPFFKTLKEHFEGVQKALFKEVKEMEEIFDQMNNEVDQNAVDKQCAEIERKNILIENENLIANCLSSQLLYVMEQSRCLDLEAEFSKYNNENQKDIKNLEHQIQEKDNVIRDLKVLVSNMNDRSCEPYNAKDVTDLLEQNEHFRVEIEKVKEHYKELLESIKITRVSTKEKTSSLLTQIEDLKAQLEGNLKVATRSSVKTKVLAPGMYAIDVEPIPPRLKNNRSAYLDCINHLKESVETELLEYVVGTCPKDFTTIYNKAASTSLTRKKQGTFNDRSGTSTNNLQKHEVHQKVQQTNVPMIHSTGVNTSTETSGSKPRSNTKKNRILPAKSENKKKVEDHPRTNKSVWTKVNRVDSSISSKRVVINSNSKSVCKTCNKCLNSANHEMCVVNILSSVNATPTVKIVLNKGKQIWKPKGKLSDNSLNKTKRVWKTTGKLFADIGYQWRPTGMKFTLGKLNCGYQWRPTGKKFALGELCPLTKLSVKCRIGRPLVSGLRKHSCFVRDMNGVDLLKGSHSERERRERKARREGGKRKKEVKKEKGVGKADRRGRQDEVKGKREGNRGAGRRRGTEGGRGERRDRKKQEAEKREREEGKEKERRQERKRESRGKEKREKNRMGERKEEDSGMITSELLWVMEIMLLDDILISRVYYVEGTLDTTFLYGDIVLCTASTSGDVSLAEPNQVNQPPDHLRKWTKDHPLDNIVGNPFSSPPVTPDNPTYCVYRSEEGSYGLKQAPKGVVWTTLIKVAYTGQQFLQGCRDPMCPYSNQSVSTYLTVNAIPGSMGNPKDNAMDTKQLMHMDHADVRI
ncbi:hypothetical protein Tco_0231684 [Tanacetum coccineum]